MTAIPPPTSDIASLIDSAHEARSEPPRSHMGCSMLGHPCDRYLWLSFRWAVQPKFPGRILRLFRRGHLEEATVISDLRAIGMDVRQVGAAQAHVDLGCHVSGSIDGIIASGVPEAPKTMHLLEIKTHSRKSFDELVRCGVQKSKPTHWVQVHLYMHGSQIHRTLYVAICKDDDRLYTERIRYDAEVATQYISRGHELALDNRMPPPLSTDPSWYVCRMCSAHAYCHDTRTTQHVNCRTCAHATPCRDSTWRCERHNADGIPVEFQRQGCDAHVLHPDMVPWQLQDGPDEWTAVYVIDGQPVRNGDQPRPGVYSSRELLANPQACAAGDQYVESLRQQFGGRIVG